MSIRIRCFPSSDQQFFDDVHRVTNGLSRADALRPEVVERVLGEVRSRYPRCRISVRDGLAILTLDEPVWYAYRDGTPDAVGPGAVVVRGRGVVSAVVRRLSRRRRSPIALPVPARPPAQPARGYRAAPVELESSVDTGRPARIDNRSG